jgi:F0F1-type ATP synthase membrane subunit b/b'
VEKLLWPAINLFGLVAFLVYKTKTPFMDFVRGRRVEIFEGLNKSKNQAQAAADRRKEVEAKIATLDQEKNKIFSEWKEKETIQTRAIQESSARILSQLKVEAVQNKKSLEEQTRIAISRGFRRSVLAQAEQKIGQALNPEVHGKIARNLTAQLERGAS